MASFGFDMAGYSSGNTVLAVGTRERSGVAHIRVFKRQSFATKLAGADFIQNQIETEAALIEIFLDFGPVFVDVPIDLQGLPAPQSSQYVWQLTKRPVDHAFDGLPPLAHRIGATTARFRALTNRLHSAEFIFETYPAASLRISDLGSTGYKGQSCVVGEAGNWHGDLGIAILADALGLKGEVGTEIDDHVIDAAICALCGLVDPSARLDGNLLSEEMARRLLSRGVSEHHLSDMSPAARYVLVKLPTTFEVRIDVVRDIASAEQIVDGLYRTDSFSGGKR